MQYKRPFPRGEVRPRSDRPVRPSPAAAGCAGCADFFRPGADLCSKLVKRRTPRRRSPNLGCRRPTRRGYVMRLSPGPSRRVGAAAVEFAVVLPLIFLLLLGTWEV